MNNNFFTLYTFQPLFVWENLTELGYYHPFFIEELDPFILEEKNKNWSFYHAYEWLKLEMLKRKIQYQFNNSNLIWAWYQWSGANKKSPDKRYNSVKNYFDKPYVLLEIELPKDRVLLSDYDAWHYVLNYWYMDKEEESEKFCSQYDFYKNKPLHCEKGIIKIEKSWRNIFDFQKSAEILEINENSQQIQATFFELFFTDVKTAHFFNNRKCEKILRLK